MIIKRSQIVDKLHELWPRLVDGHSAGGHIWIPRSEYWGPSPRSFQNFISQDWTMTVKNLDYDLKRWACTNYAAALAVQCDLYVLWLQSQNKFDEASMLEWAVAEVWATKLKGQKTSHAVNLLFLDDGNLWFFEPQSNNDAWLANSEENEIHFYKL